MPALFSLDLPHTVTLLGLPVREEEETHDCLYACHHHDEPFFRGLACGCC